MEYGASPWRCCFVTMEGIIRPSARLTRTGLAAGRYTRGGVALGTWFLTTDYIHLKGSR